MTMGAITQPMMHPFIFISRFEHLFSVMTLFAGFHYFLPIRLLPPIGDSFGGLQLNQPMQLHKHGETVRIKKHLSRRGEIDVLSFYDINMLF